MYFGRYTCASLVATERCLPSADHPPTIRRPSADNPPPSGADHPLTICRREVPTIRRREMPSDVGDPPPADTHRAAAADLR